MILFYCSLLTLFFHLPFPGLTVAGQEIFELVHLHEVASVSERSIGVSLREREPAPVSTSVVIAADSWLRARVLTSYRSNRAQHVLRKRSHACQWAFVLRSIRNLCYSLVRWGLAKELQVSEAFSSYCFRCSSQNNLKPMFNFLHAMSSPYVIDKLSLASVHRKDTKSSGLSEPRGINTIRGRKKFSFFRTSSSLGRTRREAFKVPFHFAGKPNIPSFDFPPPPVALSVLVPPATPPDVLPVILPSVAVKGHSARFLCVTKPSVPPMAKLHEVMDFAWEDGGSGCKEIEPGGSVYYTDNYTVHASIGSELRRTVAAAALATLLCFSTSEPTSFLRYHHESS